MYQLLIRMSMYSAQHIKDSIDRNQRLERFFAIVHIVNELVTWEVWGRREDRSGRVINDYYHTETYMIFVFFTSAYGLFIILFLGLGRSCRPFSNYYPSQHAPRSARARPSYTTFSASLDTGGGGFNTYVHMQSLTTVSVHKLVRGINTE